MFTEVKWKRLVGQERVRDVLSNALSNDQLGHAYLFCGERGCGKFTAALEFAMALLCFDPSGKPCYQCDSCRRVLKYSHPDLHLVMPVALPKECKSDNKLTDKGWDFISQKAKERIENTYLLEEFSSVPEIPVDWIREMNQSVTRGAMEGGYNIVIMDGVELMRKEAANAMLKTLEEPPERTVMIVITEKINAVLPTIVSRCQVIRFAYQTPELLRSELAAKLSVNISDPSLDTLIHAGSYGKALALNENRPDEALKSAAQFWRACTTLDMDKVIEQIDSFPVKGSMGIYENFFIYLLQLIHFAFLGRYADTENYFKVVNPSYRIELPSDVSLRRVEMIINSCQESLDALRIRGNSTLVLIEFAFSLMEILNDEKQ
ncbi:DNA polymerase III delta prime subunit [Chitinispirillum alkaliphilum]|nr:DNA polymerase III delta prime subunit [Chitinispirillum alkaliphilum]